MARTAAVLLALALATGAAAAERAFTLEAVDGRLPAAQRTLRVAKGDAVAVHFTSNRAGELHLHGYRLDAKVVPARISTLRFTAHATGRYRIEWHGEGDTAAGHHGAPLATLEVMPK